MRARSEIPYGRRLFGVGCLLHNSSVRRCANVLLIFRAGIQAIGSGKDLRMKVRRVMVSGACSHSGNCAPWSGSPYFLRRVRGHGLALPRKRAETGFGVKLPPHPLFISQCTGTQKWVRYKRYFVKNAHNLLSALFSGYDDARKKAAFPIKGCRCIRGFCT